MAGLLPDELVHAVPLAGDRVEAGALLDGLVRTGGVELVGRLRVEPVVRAAQTEALGCDHAEVIGREALAQGARVERLDRLVGEPHHALVALRVDELRLLEHLVDLGLLGVDRDLHLVDDRLEVVEQLRVQDVADVPELEAGVLGGLADADPDELALPHVQHALGEVHEVVELALDDRLEVRLHLAPGHIDDDAERNAGALFELVELGPDDLDLAVLDLGRVARAHELECGRALAAGLDVGVFLADALALERGAVRDRDRQVDDLDLQSADLDRLLHELVARDVGDDVLVGAHAGRQDLRDVGRRDGGEAVAIAPAAVAYHSSVTSPSASTNAKTRILL